MLHALTIKLHIDRTITLSGQSVCLQLHQVVVQRSLVRVFASLLRARRHRAI